MSDKLQFVVIRDFIDKLKFVGHADQDTALVDSRYERPVSSAHNAAGRRVFLF
ncbi:MAG TPA: hypothetical protein VN937_08665 [Blastocatellia bacterium]|nr:hypothetical protein [Blastocatellia bacterium]